MKSQLASAPLSSNSDDSGVRGLRQQILNFLADAGARAASRRRMASLTRRDLDDCGLTFADVDAAMPDPFAQDFRVSHIGWARAA